MTRTVFDETYTSLVIHIDICIPFLYPCSLDPLLLQSNGRLFWEDSRNIAIWFKTSTWSTNFYFSHYLLYSIARSLAIMTSLHQRCSKSTCIEGKPLEGWQQHETTNRPAELDPLSPLLGGSIVLSRIFIVLGLNNGKTAHFVDLNPPMETCRCPVLVWQLNVVIFLSHFSWGHIPQRSTLHGTPAWPGQADAHYSLIPHLTPGRVDPKMASRSRWSHSWWCHRCVVRS
jgi:hypothetical protein